MVSLNCMSEQRFMSFTLYLPLRYGTHGMQAYAGKKVCVLCIDMYKMMQLPIIFFTINLSGISILKCRSNLKRSGSGGVEAERWIRRMLTNLPSWIKVSKLQIAYLVHPVRHSDLKVVRATVCTLPSLYQVTTRYLT